MLISISHLFRFSDVYVPKAFYVGQGAEAGINGPSNNHLKQENRQTSNNGIHHMQLHIHHLHTSDKSLTISAKTSNISCSFRFIRFFSSVLM